MIKRILKKIFPQFLLNWYYQFFPLLGAVLYRFPSRKIVVVGVTGTNGKSTTIQLISDILRQAGFMVASLSSIRFQIGDKTRQNKLKMTMPGRLKMHHFLRQAVNKGCQYAVLEVTSEGIKQFRHKFINFDAVIFTNLEKEHIESHGSFEKYQQAKEKLFQVRGIKSSIVNLDDRYANGFLKFPIEEKWGYMIKPKAKSQKLETESQKPKTETKGINIVSGEAIRLFDDHSEFSVKGQGFFIPLVGEFNIYNALAAVSFGMSQGIDLNVMAEALKKTESIPGRMEFVIKEPFKVVVDYAHTPKALESVYKTLSMGKQQNAEKKLICVLGSCGGGRDKWKRPAFGSLAGQYCDKIILTNEDPYDEDPIQIIEEVEAGVPQSANCEKIFDRREAIRRALSLANPGDTVAITGKGGEPWICAAGGKKISWDDRQVAREEM
ncbi:UDP-N-acetylmuramoyl-L-alanyl-D-glutamate--2,6-diaminopimelate ligase [Patescibacteria group bacterium]|nr:UDP-N-acetylmuramoyl-L-alanyl-D-glutamate--2,6-diaminopimelate ligase [Patescibacteria group bacterium]MBU4022779.1 UDP-N-acetylmuramoyl-L-alanyl-D-glutamate--2,6-diaminopimelate ligase [Patescibacteria group bacterium]MBU4162022.1 UDP-N-acetylmuramoyl-L-alanyl-D-glutamate--2,6-diaminopimelate ligase [Patescibacteria group bacterium]